MVTDQYDSSNSSALVGMCARGEVRLRESSPFPFWESTQGQLREMETGGVRIDGVDMKDAETQK